MIRSLVGLAVERGLTVIADEVYDEIVFAGTHTTAAASRQTP